MLLGAMFAGFKGFGNQLANYFRSGCGLLFCEFVNRGKCLMVKSCQHVGPFACSWPADTLLGS